MGWVGINNHGIFYRATGVNIELGPNPALYAFFNRMAQGSWVVLIGRTERGGIRQGHCFRTPSDAYAP